MLIKDNSPFSEITTFDKDLVENIKNVFRGDVMNDFVPKVNTSENESAFFINKARTPTTLVVGWIATSDITFKFSLRKKRYNKVNL